MAVRLPSVVAASFVLLVHAAPGQERAPAPRPPAPKAPVEPTAPPPGPGEQRFFNPAHTFSIVLPEGWRALAPNEARRLAADPKAPLPLTFAQPNLCYAVGPVDAWLAGDYRGPWLYVAEQDGEWHVGDDYQEVLRGAWQERSTAKGEQNELGDIRLEKVSVHGVEAVIAQRRTTPPPPRPSLACLDVSCPAGFQQVTLSFQCEPDAFARWEGEFVRRVGTLDFARKPKGKRTLGDRLWWPIVSGAVISLVLLAVLKRQRARR